MIPKILSVIVCQDGRICFVYFDGKWVMWTDGKHLVPFHQVFP